MKTIKREKEENSSWNYHFWICGNQEIHQRKTIKNAASKIRLKLHTLLGIKLGKNFLIFQDYRDHFCVNFLQNSGIFKVCRTFFLNFCRYDVATRDKGRKKQIKLNSLSKILNFLYSSTIFSTIFYFVRIPSVFFYPVFRSFLRTIFYGF